MSLEQHQDGAMHKDETPDQAVAPRAAVDESRRRFTKSGLAASGVLLTVASRPALGVGLPTEKCCKSPSAWMSGNTSFHGEPPLCEGKPPSYWVDRSDRWPGRCSDDRFSQHFTCTQNFMFYNTKMLKVCKQDASDGETAELCSRLVAAYLNYLQGWTPFLKAETIKAIFNECTTKGYFTPTAGAQWTVRECINYLKATQLSA